MKLRTEIDPERKSKLVENLLEKFLDVGACMVVEESAYIDRDFSSLFVDFYARLYRQGTKYCRRFHFFSDPLDRARVAKDSQQLAEELQSAGETHYLGYIVVRPLVHSPISHAIISTRHLNIPGGDVAIRSSYKIHVLGAEFEVVGTPITEQDQLTGSCAQSTIWMVGRHFQNRHAMPWRSISDITEAAISTTDFALASVLPAGSESLSPDNMVRALRGMGQNAVTYEPEIGETDDDRKWEADPLETIVRYLDSGIPVIVGLAKSNDSGPGHAVTALGTIRDSSAKFSTSEPGPANLVSYIIVHDDQKGAYVQLPVKAEEGSTYFSFQDISFLIVPLPDKIFLKGKIAQTIARDKVTRLLNESRDKHIREAGKNVETWKGDAGLRGAKPEALVAQTYLTPGWKYKHRMLRNEINEIAKQEINQIHFPRYVWVTEFSRPREALPINPCERRIRGHVVIDATGNRFDERAVLFVHMPGIVISENFDPARPFDEGDGRLSVLDRDRAYYPKIRGQRDYTMCGTAEAV